MVALGAAVECAVHAADADSGAFGDRWSGAVLGRDGEGRGDDDVQGRLELAAERGPDVGERAGFGVQPGDGEGDGEPEFGQRAGQFLGGQDLTRQQGGEYGGEQPVFVLRALGPGGDEIGKPVPAWRLTPSQYDSPVVADRDRTALAPRDVLPDVVEVGVDGRGVAPGGPVAGRGVEGDLDAGPGQGAAGQQPLEYLVHLVDHGPTSWITSRPSQIPVAGCRFAARHGALHGHRGPRGAASGSTPGELSGAWNVPPGPLTGGRGADRDPQM